MKKPESTLSEALPLLMGLELIHLSVLGQMTLVEHELYSRLARLNHATGITKWPFRN